MNGLIYINKPLGITSSKALYAVKRKVYPSKIGHNGTLDPDAEGVLVALIGKATRLFDYMLTKQKTYVAKFRFGIETDTLDASGKTTAEAVVKCSEEEIAAALDKFVGTLYQIPPNYSAKNVDGRRAYDLARSGIKFELAPKRVEVYSFKLLGKTGEHEYSFEITCGGGTFIRSLARDLSYELGTVGHMSALVRVASGDVKLSQCHKLSELEQCEDICKYIVPIDAALANICSVTVCEEEYRKLINGVGVKLDVGQSNFKLVYEGKVFGLGRVDDSGFVRIGVNLV